MKRLTLNKALFIATGLLSLLASSWGVLKPNIYDYVVPENILPGVYTQDLFAGGSSILLLVFSILMGPNDIRKAIINIGVLGFLFYAYGIYAIEQIYTPLYPVYLAILSLSFFSIATALASLKIDAVERLHLPVFVRYASVAFGLFIAVMFSIIWFSHLIPLLQTGERIEYMFSVYIIDLVFIMPAFGITAILLIKRRALGLVGLPALFIVGIGILSPLAVAEILKPYLFDSQTNPGELQLYGILSLSFLISSIVYLTTLKTSRRSVIGNR